MYKGFCEDVEYVMGLFFRPFEVCSEKDADDDEDEDNKCGMACDGPVCFREKDADDDEDEEERKCGMGCGEEPDKKPEGEEREGGLLGPGPLQDIMKCMFDASDIDYDYED